MAGGFVRGLFISLSDYFTAAPGMAHWFATVWRYM
jgi:hypothetical protein